MHEVGSAIGMIMLSVCLSVCLSVTLCIVAKQWPTSYSKSMWTSEWDVPPKEHDFTTFTPPPQQPWAPKIYAA